MEGGLYIGRWKIRWRTLWIATIILAIFVAILSRSMVVGIMVAPFLVWIPAFIAPYLIPPVPGIIHEAENVKDVTPLLNQPKGIGGLLILPAIGLPLAIVILVLETIDGCLLDKRGNASLSMYWYLSIVMLVACLYAAQLFFYKKQSAVWAMILIAAWNILVNFAKVELSVKIWGEPNPQNLKLAFIACIQAAIWIPYFLISKRVKNTFVN